MTVRFHWKANELQDGVDSCERDPLLQTLLELVPKGKNVLEAGCGGGRWVKYLHERGWPIVGLEIGGDTVTMVKTAWPDLALVQGDCAATPFSDESFDAVLSLGVVEHWPEGPQPPLREIRRVLRRDGIAIISVPLLNAIRRVKRGVWLDESIEVLRSMRRRRPRLPFTRRNRAYRFAVYPASGDFFEYRMTGAQFADEVRRAGLEILRHAPIGLVDGIYHELNPRETMIRFSRLRFEVTPAARWLLRFFAARPGAAAHMQVVVVRKNN